MTARPIVLCPTDFSDGSRGALRYAAVVADHFGARLLVLAVEDPLFTDAIALGTGSSWDPDETRREVARFTARAIAGRPAPAVELEYEAAVGRPAEQILRVARERRCDLIVMSTHGLTGMRKLFFGSTTERVLRETTIPVLATPATADAPRDLEEMRLAVGRILVAVDLSPASLHQVQIARGVSEALWTPFLLTYVVEPVRSPLASRLHLPAIELERRTRAEDALSEFLATVPRQLHPEALVAYGDPAEEIAKIARDRRAGLIVIGLHAPESRGPRMGSVTYRVLCLVSAPVLALPPARRPGMGMPAAAAGSAMETRR